jgi:uncharacterized lipoprotein
VRYDDKNARRKMDSLTNGRRMSVYSEDAGQSGQQIYTNAVPVLVTAAMNGIRASHQRNMFALMSKVSVGALVFAALHHQILYGQARPPYGREWRRAKLALDHLRMGYGVRYAENGLFRRGKYHKIQLPEG